MDNLKSYKEEGGDGIFGIKYALGIWREGIVGNRTQLLSCMSLSPLSGREEYLDYQSIQLNEI